MRTPSLRLSLRRALPWLLVVPLCAAAEPARGASPDKAPPLPAPTGRVVHVSTESALRAAVAALTSGTTIVIAPGTYALGSTLWVKGPVSDVSIRGASHDRGDVVLAGKGMGAASDGGVPFGIWSGDGVTRLTIANLTIRDVYNHPIVFNAGTEAPRVYNVRLVNAGEQFIKANPDGAGGGVDAGIVEYSVFEYETTAKGSYTNAVDVHAGRDWIIRHNLFRRIRAPQGQLAGPAVLMWNGSRGTIVDGNTFVDCQREISLGLVPRTPDDHQGGIVRNNMIVRAAGMQADVAIAVFDSPATLVAHNTVLMNGTYPNAIEYRFADAVGVVIRHNLADRGAAARDGATAAVERNVWTAGAALYRDASAGDLHLLPSAAIAIDAAVAGDAAADWDGQPRPAGQAPDLGADEFQPATPAPPPQELCGDGIDNDLDGLVDETCPPVPASVPGPPQQLAGRVRQSTVSLAWLAPITGASVTGYVLEAGLAPGQTAYTLPLGVG